MTKNIYTVDFQPLLPKKLLTSDELEVLSLAGIQNKIEPMDTDSWGELHLYSDGKFDQEIAVNDDLKDKYPEIDFGNKDTVSAFKVIQDALIRGEQNSLGVAYVKATANIYGSEDKTDLKGGFFSLITKESLYLKSFDDVLEKMINNAPDLQDELNDRDRESFSPR